MNTMSVSEMRQIEGGIPWAFVIRGAIGLSAYARYIYEHNKMGRHVTNYGFLGLKCPICGKP